MKTKYLILGSSAAGISAINRLVKLGETDIVCATAEQAIPYNKCFLVDWLAKEKSEQDLQLKLLPEAKDKVQFKFARAISFDNDSKSVSFSDGSTIIYDKMLTAIGVSPIVPPIDGIKNFNNIFKFHNFYDTQNLKKFIEDSKPQRATVIGAGLTGVECADALARAGLQVDLVDMADHVLPRHVDKAAADWFGSAMKKQGVSFCGNEQVAKIAGSGEIADCIELKSGKKLATDLVVMAVGVRPNQIKAIGSDFAKKGEFLKVDDCFKTSLPDVWAAGDMIVAKNILNGELIPSYSWPDAMQQGMITAINMVGGTKRYPGMLQVSISHFFDHDFVSCGFLSGGPDDKEVVEQSSNSYSKHVFDSDGYLKGFMLIGDISGYPAAKRAILTGQKL